MLWQIEVLSEIVEAVRGTGVEVYLDGGVRLGTDVLKALALGARAVFVGRPVIWGLAYKVHTIIAEICSVISFHVIEQETVCKELR